MTRVYTMRAGGRQRVWHSVARRVALGALAAGAAVVGASEQAAVTNAVSAAATESRADFMETGPGCSVATMSAGSRPALLCGGATSNRPFTQASSVANTGHAPPPGRRPTARGQ